MSHPASVQTGAWGAPCKVSIYKRGEVYWYKFMWKGELVRESTKQRNDKVARQMEAAHRSSLAKGEVGIREKKPTPTLIEFCEKRFGPWIKTTTAQKTWWISIASVCAQSKGIDRWHVSRADAKHGRSLASLDTARSLSRLAMYTHPRMQCLTLLTG